MYNLPKLEKVAQLIDSFSISLYGKSHFPCNCLEASVIISCWLNHLKIDHKIKYGWRVDPIYGEKRGATTPHCWIEVNDTIVDVTAIQFKLQKDKTLLDARHELKTMSITYMKTNNNYKESIDAILSSDLILLYGNYKSKEFNSFMDELLSRVFQIGKDKIVDAITRLNTESANLLGINI